MLTGRLIPASEAHRMGMLAEVVPDDQLLDAAYAIADEIAANSPFGVWMTKEVMWSALEIPSQQALIDLENRTQVLASLTDDAPRTTRSVSHQAGSELPLALSRVQNNDNAWADLDLR